MEPQHPANPSQPLPSSISRPDLLIPTAQQHGETDVTSPSERTTLSPVYWPTDPSLGPGRSRAESASSLRGPAIRMLDHTDEDSEQFRACWSKGARIADWVVVGAKSGLRSIGSYVVFNCVIETANGGNITVRKRYSQFDTLRAHLVQTFPYSTAALPKLPPKSTMSRFEHNFLEKRREKLEYFLNCILLNPEFSASPILKDFIFNS